MENLACVLAYSFHSVGLSVPTGVIDHLACVLAYSFHRVGLSVPTGVIDHLACVLVYSFHRVGLSVPTGVIEHLACVLAYSFHRVGLSVPTGVIEHLACVLAYSGWFVCAYWCYRASCLCVAYSFLGLVCSATGVIDHLACVRLLVPDLSRPVEQLLVNAGEPRESSSNEDWNCAKTIINYSGIKWSLESFKPFKSPATKGIFLALLQFGQLYYKTPTSASTTF
ncbi:hypothetical protein J6590_064753 [Homalodisca vitripennis]|nr:hypothetical protein J6590_064753 [Homalodisca vitripennis]